MLGLLGDAEERVPAAELGLQTLLLFAPALAAFLIGLQWGRFGSVIALAVCVVAIAGLSIWSIHAVSASGLFGWQYYNETNSWPASVGMGLVLASLVLIGPIVFRNPKYATWLSVALLVGYSITSIPRMLAGCVLFAACV